MAFNLKSQSPLKQEENIPNKAYAKATRPFYSLANRAEAKLDGLLDNPTLKANKRVEKYSKENSGNFDKVDAIRHGAASMYTRKAISKKLGGGTLANIAGVIGSNVLGAGHELSALNTDHGYINGAVEAVKDMTNNLVGSLSSEKNLESNMKRFGNNGMSEATRKERLQDIQLEKMSSLESRPSPLHKQKLSPLAAKKKAARDLAYAKTDDRRKKKAHSQRMHRKDPSKKNMDWDHEDGRWESVKQNRGNEGEGTKKESGKKYKIR